MNIYCCKEVIDLQAAAAAANENDNAEKTIAYKNNASFKLCI